MAWVHPLLRRRYVANQPEHREGACDEETGPDGVKVEVRGRIDRRMGRLPLGDHCTVETETVRAIVRLAEGGSSKHYARFVQCCDHWGIVYWPVQAMGEKPDAFYVIGIPECVEALCCSESILEAHGVVNGPSVSLRGSGQVGGDLSAGGKRAVRESRMAKVEKIADRCAEGMAQYGCSPRADNRDKSIEEMRKAVAAMIRGGLSDAQIAEVMAQWGYGPLAQKVLRVMKSEVHVSQTSR